MHRDLEDSTPVLVLLWLLSSVLVSANFELSENTKGIQITATPLNVLIMLFVTFLLGMGVRKNKGLLVIPWLIASMYYMYHIQFANVGKLFRIMMYYKSWYLLGWTALITYTASIGIKMHLMFVVSQVVLKQWLIMEVRENAEDQDEIDDKPAIN